MISMCPHQSKTCILTGMKIGKEKKNQTWMDGRKQMHAMYIRVETLKITGEVSGPTIRQEFDKDLTMLES